MGTNTAATPKPGEVWRSVRWAEPREATVTAVRNGLVYYRQGIRWKATTERFLAEYEQVGSGEE